MDPVNIQGLHNLCVVYVERGRLAAAQACLSHAHEMAPNEDYIIRHLQIVQTRIARLKTSPGMDKEKEIAFGEFDPKEFGVGDIKLDTSTVVSNVITDPDGATTATTLDDNRKALEKDMLAKSSNKKPITPTATTTTSVSSSKKVNPATSGSMGVMAHHLPSSQIEEPVFIESDAMTSHIHNDYHYRPSNSGHDTMSRNINANFHYNRKVIKSLSQNFHHQHHQNHQNSHRNNQRRSDNGASSTTQSTRGSKPRPITGDFDDPSSGMS